MQSRTRKIVIALVGLATLVAVCFDIFLSLDPDNYFFYRPEDRQDWVYHPGNVVLVCSVMTAEAALALMALIFPRPRALWLRCLHFRDGGGADTVPAPASFWEDLAAGKHPELDQGRLMSAFNFSEPWSMWERHPAGEELVMLLSGSATVVLEVFLTPGAGTEHRPVGT